MSYSGADFCGWQIQPQEPSVQEALEKALGTLLKARTGVVGAGRTDTGVSAAAYVAHFDFDGPVPEALLKASSANAATDSALDCRQLCYKLNAILPKGVSVSSIEPAAPDFHARFDARLRQYTYYLHRRKDPFLGSVSYFFAYPEFDVEAMNRAARLLLGTHDFSCFEKSGGDNKTSICTVYSAGWEPYEPELHAAAQLPQCRTSSPFCSNCPGGPQYWRFVIEADRFLRNMVRAIVGTLLEVGRGRRSEDSFASLVLPVDNHNEGPSRSLAGESVPAHALFLSRIDY